MSQSDLNTVIDQITVTIKNNSSELVGRIKTIFKIVITNNTKFDITNNTKYCYIDLKNNLGSVSVYDKDNKDIQSDCTITTNSAYFIELFDGRGKLYIRRDYRSNKFRITSDPNYKATKLDLLIDKINTDYKKNMSD